MWQIGFVTLIGSESTAADATLLVRSLRAFGGEFQDAPVWILHPGSTKPIEADFNSGDTYPTRFEIGHGLQGVPFGAKVSACATAEQMLSGELESLVWINPRALMIRPPLAFLLDRVHGAALRPVHIRNIGSPIDKPPDDFWEAIYRYLGIRAPTQVVESYVDSHSIRPYFNTHLFAIDPSLGLLQTWLEHFTTLACDDRFLAEHCRDELHQIFLHQALFSALLTLRLDWDSIRILPPEYSYPLHLHPEIPPDRQVENLERLVCPVYEEPFKYPDTLNGLPVGEPLANWLQTLTGAST
jgi:hypothetical protein